MARIDRWSAWDVSASFAIARAKQQAERTGQVVYVLQSDDRRRFRASMAERGAHATAISAYNPDGTVHIFRPSRA